MGKRCTLKDVAKEAGVTSATVSYVINNTPGQTIRPETRKRVLDAVAKLKYTPNIHARTLRNQKNPCIGVVIKKNLAVPRFSQMTYGIQTRLEAEGYNVLLLGNTMTSLGITDYVEAYLAGRVSGIIFLGTENRGPDARSLSTLVEEQAPLVVFDSQTQSNSYSTVDLDYEGGAELICTRLFEKGCTSVCYLRPLIDTAQETLREAGVRSACNEANIPIAICETPITLDNLEIWDARYSVGDTEDGLRLTQEFIDCVGSMLPKVPEGGAVISSWATWTHYCRRCETERHSTKHITYAELANNGESWLAADLYTRLPNYTTGEACAEEILSLLRGNAPSARSIKLSNIIEATLE